MYRRYRGHIAIFTLLVLTLLGCAFFALQSDPISAQAASNGTEQSLTEAQRESMLQFNTLLQNRFQKRQAAAVAPGGGSDGGDDGGSPVPGSKFPLQSANMPDFRAVQNLYGQAPGERYLDAGAPGLGALLPDANFASSAFSPEQQQTNWPRMATTMVNAVSAASGENQALGVDGLGLWTSTSIGWLSNTRPSTKYQGNLFTLMGGADYLTLDDRLLLGMGVGWEHLYLNTDFNDGTTYSNALSLLPYASVAITPTTFFDVAFGLSLPHYETKRTDFANNVKVDGDYDTTRTFIATNVNQYFYLDQWTFNARLGNIYSNEYRPEYTESNGNSVPSGNTYIGELQAGGRVAYDFGRVTPYVGATFLWDYALRNASDVDQTEVQGSTGINVEATNNLLMSLDLTNSFFRENTYNTTLSMSLRYQF